MTHGARSTARWRAMRGVVVLYAHVAVGAAIGGVGRALVSLAAIAVAGPGFPWGTLAANAAGSFLIGFYATLTEPGGRLMVSARARQFVMTGICGGFTTFSVFSLETFRFAEAGNHAMAAINIGASVVGWLASVWIGAALASRLNRLGGARITLNQSGEQ